MADSKSMLPFIKKRSRSRSRELERNKAWLRRKSLRHGHLKGRLVGRSIMDEDLDELRGCIDLGFGFASDSGSVVGLVETFPALGLYHAIHKQHHDSVVGFGSSIDGSPPDSPPCIISPGASPERVKKRLRHWARVVACSVRQSC